MIKVHIKKFKNVKNMCMMQKFEDKYKKKNNGICLKTFVLPSHT